ncbi:NYN domain-containing protein [Patescibacteria group bacterium]|nr:NYN domain-containing protein [Patescibacteria group bacterium]MBU1500025.1 NYN domain-containing protein [Patescibacteria group bacterium]
MKTKTYLFIDGSNLYAGQYDLFGPKRYLDFSRFINEIEKRLKVKFQRLYFYASYSPRPKRLTQKIKQYLKNEALFYRSVKSLKNLTFFKGYRSKTSGKEKEVDVKLAVDIVDMTYRGGFSELFLVSGDADFMHALLVAKRLHKKISIISLENRIPFRFSYLFLTYVFCFNQFKIKFDKKQKIKLIKLPQNLIKKIPRMHASWAS